MNKMVVCAYCGKEFEYDKCRDNRRFCNEECRNNFYGKTKIYYSKKICKYCGEEFMCSSSTPTKLFCNKECINIIKNRLDIRK